MMQHKVKKPPKDVSQEAVVMTEVGFYQGWCELMQLAFKKDGMRGVVGLAAEVLKHADALSVAADEESPGCFNLHRATIAAHFFNDWFGPVLEKLRAMPDGDWYFELKDGGTTDYPQPGQELRTFSESLKMRDEGMKVYDDWSRLRDTNPAAAKELIQMFAANHCA